MRKVALMLVILAVCSSFVLCGCRTSGQKSAAPLGERLEALKDTSFDEQIVKALAGEKEWREYGGNPVLRTGETGTWDAGALGSMTVLKVDDVLHMYYEAWGVRSEKDWDASEYESLQIGHAVSLDGVHWLKDSANPVVPRGAEGEWDRTGTWDPYVIHEDGIFKMWYGGGGGREACDWAYAESEDGRHFVKKGRISQIEHVEDCHVVHDEEAGKYYMYYWDRRHEPHGLFRAESPDEMDFDFDNAKLIKIDGDEEEEMYKFTHVIREGDHWYMFYGDFLRPHCPESWVRLATSSDGLHWTSRNKRLVKGHDGEVLKLADDLYLMYYGPRNHFDAKDCDIRLAIYSGELKNLVIKKE
jgi:hypothetical protein